MNIGVDVRSLQSQQRFQGVGYYTRQLLAALAVVDQANQYVLFGLGPQNESVVELRARFAQSSYHQLRRPATHQRLAEAWDQVLTPYEAWRHGLDVLFYPSLNNIAWWVPTKKVVMIQDMILSLYGDAILKTGLKYRFMCAAAQRANRILCPSESTSHDVQRLLHVKPQQIAVTPLAADVSFAPVQDRALCERVCAQYGITHPFVLYVGDLADVNHNRRKNLPMLVRAFAAAVSDQQEHYQLVLAGKRGPYTAVLQQIAVEAGVSDRVVFTDFVPYEQLAPLLTAAMVFVYPSIYEGFGLPVLQALACGTPTITTNVSSLPEVIADAGIVIDPWDEAALQAQLKRLLIDSAERTRLSVQGTAQAAKFSWQRTAELTLNALQTA